MMKPGSPGKGVKKKVDRCANEAAFMPSVAINNLLFISVERKKEQKIAPSVRNQILVTHDCEYSCLSTNKKFVYSQDCRRDETCPQNSRTGNRKRNNVRKPILYCSTKQTEHRRSRVGVLK